MATVKPAAVSTGEQLHLDADGNITTLAPPMPDVPDRVAPEIEDPTTSPVDEGSAESTPE